jgi:DNA-3-methyladenine glycosylase II
MCPAGFCFDRLAAIVQRRFDATMTTIIDSEKALAKGLAALKRRDPLMRDLVARGAVPPLRKREPGFAGLAGIVVAQQLSVASAAAIWARLVAALGPLQHGTVLAASDATLRAAGLSAPKIRTLRAMAEAIDGGGLALDGLARLPAEEAHGALTAVRGIGPWTADVYLLFCLGHPDVLPAGDLALQEAARLALGLDARPGEKALREIAERWRPWRGVAARVLWAYYKVIKQGREGMLLTSS